MRKMKYMTGVVAAVLLATACKKDDITPPIDKTTLPRTMAAFIQNNYDLSLLNAALQKTGLYDTLAQAGAYTFFAPDNNAFAAIGIGSVAQINSMNTDSLRHQLRYHLLRNRYFVASFPSQIGYSYTSATGEPLYASASNLYGSSADNRQLFINGAMVYNGAKRNIALANGVIHLVSKPLQYHAGTVQEYITRDTSLSLFAAAMQRFNLWDGLQNNSKVTVFVPDNAAFRRYGLTQDSIARMNPASYQDLAFGVYPLLLKARHIFSTDSWQITSEQYGPNGIYFGNYVVTPEYQYNGNNNTENATVSVSYLDVNGFYQPNDKGPGAARYKGGSAKGADHLTGNGIVHVIDDLLFYPELLKK
ncbi:Uncaracterized surface protein containing fasciclin (FAS1) repeats [Filimonas lacunae]|uniref:Uncaracterized surface protein containing fasciclin (FAS1) repeats n=1 Tax=Filimonas lacunae TaxID=477680 RepID=A0A173MEV3_9BACT|nr:fasciclin domain-containing protein [Filimonas lacunae]BAV06009.1 transforming growth factor-beta induced protein IG-H3 precursor [Filimonas lacunae]SIT24167.1 Uncaracterized surface protein containing fasciclin (FAS1) repeats [Filimonas lacunae]